jgi:hypothetical protein
MTVFIPNSRCISPILQSFQSEFRLISLINIWIIKVCLKLMVTGRFLGGDVAVPRGAATTALDLPPNHFSKPEGRF